MIYNAIIAPFLDYDISIWGSAANIYLERLVWVTKACNKNCKSLTLLRPHLIHFL